MTSPKIGRPLGVQLFSVLAELHADLDATLAGLRDLGFTHVETAGLVGRTPRMLREALDRAGLGCTSAHVPLEPLVPTGEPDLRSLDAVIDMAGVLGLERLVVPIFPLPARAGGQREGEHVLAYLFRAAQMIDADDWLVLADTLNAKAAALAGAGLTLAYHNHNVEFARFGDRTGYDLLVERTDPALVSFELDVGWVAAAGLDPAALLLRHPGRFSALHLKDVAPVAANASFQGHSTEVGAGMVDWRAVLAAADRIGVAQFYVEQEPPFPGPPLASLGRSIAFLQQIDRA